MKLKIFLSTVLFSFVQLSLFAQPAVNGTSAKTPNEVKMAEKLYNDYGYKASLEHFQSASALETDDLIKIANSYRLNHDTENAELWYSQVVEQSENPLYQLYYAQALHSNRNYKEAKKYYLAYDASLGAEGNADRRGQLLAEAVDQIHEFKHTSTQIQNEDLVNTDKLDFSPTFYKEGVVFVSTRRAHSDKSKGLDSWIDDNFMSLFYAQTQSDKISLESVEEFSHDINTKFHEGPVTFSKDGKRIFFTRNNYNKGKRKNDDKGVMKLKIYTSTFHDDAWGDAQEMNWSTDQYEECHPTLSADARTLYFSSDRKGGYGGMDLYKSEFKGGQWSNPINLGESINTAGNEVFPFIHDDGTLYFASNGWGGLGGLDIFKSAIAIEQEWHKAENIGTPFNSNKDDFGFILNVPRTKGYLTSAREGGAGQDDIYSFLLPADGFSKKSKIKVCAFRANDNLRLENVEVTVTEQLIPQNGKMTKNEEGEFVFKVSPTAVKDEYNFSLKLKQQNNTQEGLSKPRSFTTNKDGQFVMNAQANRLYNFVAKKDGFVLAEESYSTNGKYDFSDTEFCIPIPLEAVPNPEKVNTSNCLVLEGSVVNKKYGNKIPKANVTMVDLCTGEEYVVDTDKDGNFSFPCIPCGCEFALKGEKKNFNFGTDNVSSMKMPCDKAGIVTAEIPMVPNLSGNPKMAAPSPTPMAANPPNPPVNNAKTSPIYTRPNTTTTYNVGAVIELKNIYYDFLKFNIRNDAEPDLIKVVKLMKKFPSMHVELGSHTDSRGTDKFNNYLSRKRANAARDYIVKKGISGNRITAVGYGEKQLRNHCENFQECSEDDHQYNRRTEIKITKLDKSGLDVRYIDNAPEKIDRANPKRKFVWE